MKYNTCIKVHLSFLDQSGSDGREKSSDGFNALFGADFILQLNSRLQPIRIRKES